MTLRRVDTPPELVEVASIASEWSESLHQPSLSEATRLPLSEGRGTGFVSDHPAGIATLTATKRSEVAMVEIAVPPSVSASDFWDAAEPAVILAADEKGFRALELLTWDAALGSRLRGEGWRVMRGINRGSITPLPASPALPPTLTSFTGGRNVGEGT